MRELYAYLRRFCTRRWPLSGTALARRSSCRRCASVRLSICPFFYYLVVVCVSSLCSGEKGLINEAELKKGGFLGGSHFRVLNPNFRKGTRKDHLPPFFIRCNNNKSKHTILLKFFLCIDQGEA